MLAACTDMRKNFADHNSGNLREFPPREAVRRQCACFYDKLGVGTIDVQRRVAEKSLGIDTLVVHKLLLMTTRPSTEEASRSM